MHKQAGSRGWERKELSLRLSRRRKEQLKAIAATLPASATPTEVVDAALTTALAKEMDMADDLSALHEAIHAGNANHSLQLQRLETSVSSLVAEIAALRKLILAVSEDGDQPN